ncbi:hypothetical protein GJ744_000593 [Endocarpon pusillum]|uniref:Uncharacterized protein n=1 Tax=Endocarpon pusillum TaxID=364733 RepID=A0A8H7ABA7_9EURO|nr:hypothetical protein GJ744_000593 [Endocarpon pusillum]
MVMHGRPSETDLGENHLLRRAQHKLLLFCSKEETNESAQQTDPNSPAQGIELLLTAARREECSDGNGLKPEVEY